MRSIVFAAIVLAGCKGTSKKQDPAPAAVAVVQDWKPVEALATTPPGRGSADELVRALEIAKTHGDAWRTGDFAQGTDAIAALQAWSKADGALPPLGSPMQAGVTSMGFASLSALVVGMAKTAVDLAPAEMLASKLIVGGRNLLEVQVGVSMLRDLAQKRAVLSAPPIALPKLDLVGVLAGEALQSRASMDYALTPEGRKELEQAAEDMPAHVRQTIEDKGEPNAAEAKALAAFWIAALKGAQHDESPDVTLARLQSAVDTAPSAIKHHVTTIPRAVKMLLEHYRTLANEPR